MGLGRLYHLGELGEAQQTLTRSRSQPGVASAVTNLKKKMDSIKVRCEVRSRISVSCPHLDLADLHLHGWLGSGQLFTCGLGAPGHPRLVEQQASSNWASGQRQAKNSSEAGALTWGYVQEGGAGLKADTCRAVESCSLDAHEKTGHCRLTSGTAVSRGHSRHQLPLSGGIRPNAAFSAGLPLSASGRSHDRAHEEDVQG